jgi:hypothetical protein
MTSSRLILTRPQILSLRQRVSTLDERLPNKSSSFERAAWAGEAKTRPTETFQRSGIK